MDVSDSLKPLLRLELLLLLLEERKKERNYQMNIMSISIPTWSRISISTYKEVSALFQVFFTLPITVGSGRTASISMLGDQWMEGTHFFRVYTYKQRAIGKGDTIKLWAEGRKRVDGSVRGIKRAMSGIGHGQRREVCVRGSGREKDRGS